MMNNKELAWMAAKLYVPVTACKSMDMTREIEPDAHYALHDTLADMQPDEALLSIAITAKHIAKCYAGTNSGTEVLSMECDRIIDEYGPLWLQHEQNGKKDNGYLVSILENIPEDLETMAELIEINLAYASYDNPVIAEICEILQIQAGAHAIIAEEFLNVMEMAAAQNRKRSNMPSGFLAANTAENVIAFPKRMITQSAT